MNRSSKIVATLSIFAMLASAAVAIEGGNPKKGKYLYKKTCKTCHSEAGEGGKLTPLSKTMSQWDRFFEKDKHSAKPEVLKNMSPQDALDIQQFLYDHAADSDQPQTCG